MNVMGLTPCHGAMPQLFVRALVDSCAAGVLQRWETRGGALVGNVRDQLAHTFLASDADVALWIDADQWFTPDIGWAILNAFEYPDINIIGAPYAKRHARGFVGGRVIGPPVYEPLAGGARHGALREVQHTGMGFMAVRRRVYEDIAEDARTMTYDTGDGQLTAFHHYPVDEPWPDDVSFLRLAIRAGHKAWLHTAMPVGHIDGNTIIWPPMERGFVIW